MGGGTTTVERDVRSTVTLYKDAPWGAPAKGPSRAKVVLLCVVWAAFGFVVGWMLP